MQENVLIAVIGGCATLVVGFIAAGVAIWVYLAGERVRLKEAAREQQRLMVVRMLDTIEQSIDSRLAPSLFRIRRNPTVGLTLALPRLLLELPRADLPVAEWAAGQVQSAVSAVRFRTFVNRVMRIEEKLISWHRGDVPTDWFLAQLRLEPYNPRFRLARRVRLAIWLRDLSENVGIGLVLGAAVISARTAWKR